MESKNPSQGTWLIQGDLRPPLTSAQIQGAQENGSIIGKVLKFKEKYQRPSREAVKAEYPDVAMLLKQWFKLCVGGRWSTA